MAGISFFDEREYSPKRKPTKTQAMTTANEYPELKVMRRMREFSLVSSFNGISHTWYIDNQDEVTEDIGILEADTLMTAKPKEFMSKVKSYFE